MVMWFVGFNRYDGIILMNLKTAAKLLPTSHGQGLQPETNPIPAHQRFGRTTFLGGSMDKKIAKPLKLMLLVAGSIMVVLLPTVVKLEQGAGQYLLGQMYAEGRGVHQDDAKAKEWFEKAAAQDDGCIYEVFYRTGL
jgi:TPR repeat protein